MGGTGREGNGEVWIVIVEVKKILGSGWGTKKDGGDTSLPIKRNFFPGQSGPGPNARTVWRADFQKGASAFDGIPGGDASKNAEYFQRSLPVFRTIVLILFTREMAMLGQHRFSGLDHDW